jgi:hypothetical protein
MFIRAFQKNGPNLGPFIPRAEAQVSDLQTAVCTRLPLLQVAE